MPPKIIVEKLGSTVHLPLAEHLDCLTIQHDQTPGAAAVRCPKRADVNAFWPTMDRVRPRIICSRKNFLRLDHLDNHGLSGVGLRINNVQTRGTQAWHDQVTPLHMRMR